MLRVLLLVAAAGGTFCQVGAKDAELLKANQNVPNAHHIIGNYTSGILFIYLDYMSLLVLWFCVIGEIFILMVILIVLYCYICSLGGSKN